MVSPSLRICIDSGNVNPLVLFREQFDFTFSLWFFDPTGIITVLSLLNLAPEAAHHLSRISKRVSGLSFFERKTIASLAKSARMTLWCVSGVFMFRPASLSIVLSMWDMGSMARLKRRQDSGPPCHTPLDTWNLLLISPFRITVVSASEYSDFIVFTRLRGIFIDSRTFHR